MVQFLAGCGFPLQSAFSADLRRSRIDLSDLSRCHDVCIAGRVSVSAVSACPQKHGRATNADHPSGWNFDWSCINGLLVSCSSVEGRRHARDLAWRPAHGCRRLRRCAVRIDRRIPNYLLLYSGLEGYSSPMDSLTAFWMSREQFGSFADFEMPKTDADPSLRSG